MNPVKSLQKHGQAIWLDFLARGFIAKGDLKTLIESDGVRGVTSNPAIFEKAIGSSAEYDSDIGRALNESDRAAMDLYESVAIDDIRAACDVLRPVYDETKGADGFVSLEVSPYLAHRAKDTVAEGERLWAAVDRKNLMIKVPATREGLPAIRELTSKGISVNITLLFSQAVYREVAEAYIAGLEAYVKKGGDPSHVASVASFFVSRIDTAVDNKLDAAIETSPDPAVQGKLRALKGKVAIANAKLAYQDYKTLFGSARWTKLAGKGAKPQRLLWASTGTKNKDYSDVLYIEELIGPNTVNTVPPPTLDAFRDHGAPRDSLELHVEQARTVLSDLDASGISLDEMTATLVTEGVQLFADAFDKLLGAVAHKRTAVLGNKISGQTIAASGLKKDLDAQLEVWRTKGNIRRLWDRDTSLWSGADEDKWLGWLTSVKSAQNSLPTIKAFTTWVRQQRFSDAVVFGMGGSSLGPEVLANTFGKASGFPKLHVLDSTDPAQVSTLEHTIDLAHTLFIVSSKSGSTTEPNAMKDYFLDRVAAKIGRARAAKHFVAVTDPGSSLDKDVKKLGYAGYFHGDPTIGGRYSVLSPFGLVPAAAAGIDVAKFLASAQAMVHACGPDVPPAENPAVQLGLLLGVGAISGRDKVTISCSERIADFGTWAEQLIAESTGKGGKGLIPVDDEPLASPETYGNDRIFVDIHVDGDGTVEDELAALEAAGHPVVRITLASANQIGQEFFRFEMATAVAGAVMQLNPFDQPDVESAKIKTRELTKTFESAGALPKETPVWQSSGIEIYTDARNKQSLTSAGAGNDLTSWLKALLSQVKTGDYVGLLAYIERNHKHIAALDETRLAIRDRLRVATCAQFGPRFLHSTGQAYKGGPNTGVFIQITADNASDLALPGQKLSFGVIEAAQARGDFDVLTERGRRALRVHIKGNLDHGLVTLNAAIADALK